MGPRCDRTILPRKMGIARLPALDGSGQVVQARAHFRAGLELDRPPNSSNSIRLERAFYKLCFSLVGYPNSVRNSILAWNGSGGEQACCNACESGRNRGFRQPPCLLYPRFVRCRG